MRLFRYTLKTSLLMIKSKSLQTHASKKCSLTRYSSHRKMRMVRLLLRKSPIISVSGLPVFVSLDFHLLYIPFFKAYLRILEYNADVQGSTAQTDFCKRIADKIDVQTNRHALETDTHLRLNGAPLGSVYCIGDCSTVQNNVADHLIQFLRSIAHEKGKDPEKVELTFKEWREVASRVKKRFPQASDHLRRLDKLFEQYDKDKSGKLDFAELHELLIQIDSKLTSLPATAQRAHQQGQYLARKFNKLAQAAPGMAANEIDYGDVDEAVYKAFDYRHMGSLAYVGNAAIFDFNGMNFSGGLLAVYLWRSIYFAQSVSFRTRVLLAMDWSKRALFGRGTCFVVCFLSHQAVVDMPARPNELLILESSSSGIVHSGQGQIHSVSI